MRQLLRQLAPDVTDGKWSFRRYAEEREILEELCGQHPQTTQFENLGESEQGRPVDMIVLGRGPQRISLMAGAHSDEPVGSETLRTLIREGIKQSGQLGEVLDRFTFVIFPHINPDGEKKNWKWMKEWPDPLALLQHHFRELPGRDLEFGFPEMRVENRLVSDAMRSMGPFDLHMSLHGMSYSEGALLLIERHWIDRTIRLRKHFEKTVARAGLGLHDHDRGGEKGFRYIGPGFATTPEGAAMREHFLEKDDPETAEKFHQSSMEFVRDLGNEPLCLVTELPLFLVGQQERTGSPGVPETYLAFKEELSELEKTAAEGNLNRVRQVFDTYNLRPLPVAKAVSLQLETIGLGLEAVY